VLGIHSYGADSGELVLGLDIVIIGSCTIRYVICQYIGSFYVHLCTYGMRGTLVTGNLWIHAEIHICIQKLPIDICIWAYGSQKHIRRNQQATLALIMNIGCPSVLHLSSPEALQAQVWNELEPDISGRNTTQIDCM
jgi:hypothetical protein